MKKENNFEITNVEAYAIGSEIFITMQWDGDESGVDDLYVELLNGEKEFLTDIVYPQKKETFRLNYQDFEFIWEKDQRNELTFYLAMYDKSIGEDGSYSKEDLLAMKGPYKVSFDHKQETIKFKELVSKYFKEFSGNEEFLLMLLYVAKKEFKTGFLEKILCKALDKIFSSGCGYNEDKELVEIADNLNLIRYLETILSQRKSDEDKVSMRAFVDFRSISSEWYERNIDWAFDYIYSRIVDVRKLKRYTQLNGLSLLLAELLGANNGYVYLPYADIESIKLIKDVYNEPKVSFILQNEGYENNILRLYLLIKKIKDYKVLDSNPSSEWYGEGMDYIVFTPSWKDSKYANIERIEFLERSAYDVRCKSVGIYNLSPEGKKQISNLVENDLLEYIILLPRDVLLNNSADKVLIVTNKDKERKGEVCFINAEACLTKDGTHRKLDVDAILDMLGHSSNGENVRWVKNGEIAEYDYIIHPYIYTSLNEYTYPDSYTKVGLGEIIEPINELDPPPYPLGKVINSSLLNRTLIDCMYPIRSQGETVLTQRSVSVRGSVILFSMKRDCLFTYCGELEDYQHINVENDIIPLRLKDDAKKWINPYYLCYELSRKAEVFKRRMLTFGISQELFSSEGLSKLLKVAFPSKNIKDQELILGQLRNQLEDSQKQEISLQEIIEGMKKDYMNQVRARRHDMRPYLSNLSSVERLMKVYIKEIDSSPKLQEKLLNLLSNLKTSLDGLKTLVSALSEEETYGVSEKLDICEYFKHKAEDNNIEITGYKLECHIDDAITDLYVEIAKVDIDRVVNNILENAKRHGFVGMEPRECEVIMSLKKLEYDNLIQIDFINNGVPWPMGMDKMRYGLKGEKAGATGNSGVGGSVVKNIVEHYKGQYDIFMEGEKVVVRIIFPIIN